MKKSILFCMAVFVFSLTFPAVFSSDSKDSSMKEIYKVTHSADDFFDKNLPADFFKTIAEGKINRQIYPRFSDRKAWEKARQNPCAAAMIKNADAIAKNYVPPLLFSSFRRFAVDGNRLEYQTPHHKRRENLGYLALALCLTGDKEKYMPRLLDYAVAIMEETSWCVPAHSHWIKHTWMNRRPVDLFSAETGVVMAMLHYVLGEELDKEIEGFSERIRRITLERTIYTLFYHPESSDMHGWYNTDKPNNWGPWCAANCLLTILLLEEDNEKMALFAKELLHVCARFVSCYADDGYCNKGPSYYSKAGLQLFYVLSTFHKMSPGSMDKIFAMPRIRAIFEFIAHMRIGNKYQVNFGDGSPEFNPDVAGILSCSELIKSDILREAGSVSKNYLGLLGDHLVTGMRLLFDSPQTTDKIMADNPFTYFKDCLAILRSSDFSVTLKGGTNNESHNHNDLGHLTVFYKGEPIIVDAGNEHYTKVNASSRRYTLWYTRGSGHNAPVFGEAEQQAGANYIATFIRAEKNILSLDLSKSYPEDAGVVSFVRTLNFTPEKVVLRDEFQLKKATESRIKFLTPQDVKLLADGTLQIGNARLILTGIQVEKTEARPKMNSSWNCVLTEIILKSTHNSYTVTFTGK